MKRISVLQANAGWVLFIGILTFASSSCSEEKKAKGPYIYIPHATFHQGTPPASSVPCDWDHPLYCSVSKKCCPAGFPYHCESTHTCHAGPACSGYDTCSTPAPIIQSVTSSKSTIATGGTVTFTITFTVVVGVIITETIIYIEELGGYFEDPVSSTDSQNGVTEIGLGITDTTPPSTSCIEIEKTCYAQAQDPISSVNPDISLRDNAGNVSGGSPQNIPIEGAGGGGGGGGSCQSPYHPETCPNGTQRCCEPGHVCCRGIADGSIGCLVPGLCE